jgi:hypothetical protein
MLMAQVFVKRSAYRFVLQDKAVGGFSLTNDIKRKIKPLNSQIPLKITLVKS